MIPIFIEKNRFLLKMANIDLENTKELLEIINWEKKEVKWIRSLFMWFISKTVFDRD